MPNWCYSHLAVEGEATEIDRFNDSIITNRNEGTADLTRLCPMPEVLEGTQSPTPTSPEPHPNWAELLAKGEITQEWHDQLVNNQRAMYEAGQKAKAETGYTNWYDWSIDHWGTKWAPRVTYFNRGEHDMEVRFESAWSPATELMRVISGLFPTLTFIMSFEEEADSYLGTEIFRAGEIIAESSVEGDGDSDSKMPDTFKERFSRLDDSIPEGDDWDAWAKYYEDRTEVYNDLYGYLRDDAVSALRRADA